MPCSIFFGKNHRLCVAEPFWAKKGTIYIPKGTRGRVIDGQTLYGYVTLEFYLGRRKIRGRSVVTDYSMFVEDVDYTS